MIDEAKERALFAERTRHADDVRDLDDLEGALDIDDVFARVDSRKNARKSTWLARANHAATGLAAAAACFAVLRGASGALGLVSAESPIVRDSARTFESAQANGVVPACGLFSSAWDTACEPSSSWSSREEIASESRTTCDDSSTFSSSAPACEAISCGVDVTCERVGP